MSDARTTDDAREARTARLLLAVFSVVFFFFLFFYVPRMNNYVLSDREFTGWVGPIAEHLVRGERPYVDFIVPLPPGSFALLAIIQRIAGRALLLQELWVAGIAHWMMGMIAYGIAARFSTRRVALLTSACTLVLVTQTAKECVYDHTSLVVAWLGILAGAHAATERSEKRRPRLWFLAGCLATATLAFKQSTAVGMVFGWSVAIVYLLVVEWRARRGVELRQRLRDAGAFAAGGALGLVLVVFLLVLLRASIPGFVQAVFRDGPELKGGLGSLALNLVNFTVYNDAFRNTLVPLAVAIAIGVGIARRHGHLHVGGEAERAASLSPRTAAWIGASFLAVYLPASLLLAGEVRAMHRVFTAIMETLRNVPALGLAFGVAFFVAHLDERHAETPEHRIRGHALNAILLASIAATMVYDTSFVHFLPFYYNEPSIAVALLALFVATERSGYRWATPLAFALSVLPVYGTKLQRALSADTPVRWGYWAGMRVNYRGVEVLNAAQRAQELAGPNGTVLVLPEDVQLAGLMRRPRPPLLGAILFVDQYPRRLLAHDRRVLDEQPPDVIVIHPRRAADWRAVFHTWSSASAAEELLDHVLTDILPARYQLDSSYPTIYFWDQGQIDVYVRKDGEP